MMEKGMIKAYLGTALLQAGLLILSLAALTGQERKAGAAPGT